MAARVDGVAVESEQAAGPGRLTELFFAHDGLRAPTRHLYDRELDSGCTGGFGFFDERDCKPDPLVFAELEFTTPACDTQAPIAMVPTTACSYGRGARYASTASAGVHRLAEPVAMVYSGASCTPRPPLPGFAYYALDPTPLAPDRLARGMRIVE